MIYHQTDEQIFPTAKVASSYFSPPINGEVLASVLHEMWKKLVLK